jgi:hypothetical protein
MTVSMQPVSLAVHHTELAQQTHTGAVQPMNSHDVGLKVTKPSHPPTGGPMTQQVVPHFQKAHFAMHSQTRAAVPGR